MKQYDQFHWQLVYAYPGSAHKVYFLGFDDDENILFTLDSESPPQGAICKYSTAWNHIKAQLDALLAESDKSPTELKWQTGVKYPADGWILVQYTTGGYQVFSTYSPCPALPFPVRRWAVLP